MKRDVLRLLLLFVYCQTIHLEILQITECIFSEIAIKMIYIISYYNKLHIYNILSQYMYMYIYKTKKLRFIPKDT